MFKISCPIRVTKNKRGASWSCNLNNYRNTHHQILNATKRMFKVAVTEGIQTLPKLSGALLVYTLYTPNKKLVDVSNVCSVVDKYFCDALVSLGILEDDNYTFVPLTMYYFGGIDRDNPRCDVHIIPNNPETPQDLGALLTSIVGNLESTNPSTTDERQLVQPL